MEDGRGRKQCAESSSSISHPAASPSPLIGGSTSLSELLDLLAELGVRARVFVEVDAGDGGFPGLSQRSDARGGAARMRENSAAGHVEEVDGILAAIGFGRLQTGLTGRDDGENFEAAEQRFGARFDRSDDGIVRLPEFVSDAVDVYLVDPGEPPKFLMRGEVDAEERVAVEHAPAVAVAVDGE